MKKTTIAAIATPIGIGGIGIIRISGPRAFTTASSVFVPKNINLVAKNTKFIDTNIIQSHKLYYGHIINPDKGNILDEVLITFMRAPNTYTKEDIVEIQAHSGFVSLNSLLSLILKNGAIIADPGEFTKRAFLNGRIDLTQAESTIDLINAKTHKAALMAVNRLRGSSKNDIKKLYSIMLKIQANYEAIIEFNIKVDESNSNTYEIIEKNIIPKIKILLQKEKNRILYQEGITVAIVGTPNVGKSSLMNQLIDHDRSIVTNIPGTTRDIIKEHMLINNLPIILHDTAGIHNSNNKIEQIGIAKSLKIIKKTDILIIVIDACKKVTINEIEMVKKYNKKKIIIVINKIDIASTNSIREIKQKFKIYKTIKVSAKKNLFIDNLKTAIFETATEHNAKDARIDVASLNLRQYLLLKKTKTLLNELLLLIRKNTSIDMLSYQIGECIRTLSEISGSRKNDTLYDYIFSNFCIGK